MVLHILLSMSYVCYILHWKPYTCPQSNRMQFQNEVSVIICSIVLIAVKIIDDLDLRYNFAFWYIIANSSLLITNIKKIGTELFFRTIPNMINKQKYKNYKKSHEEKIIKWLEDKKIKKDLNSISKEIYEHAETVVEMRDLNQELCQMH